MRARERERLLARSLPAVRAKQRGQANDSAYMEISDRAAAKGMRTELPAFEPRLTANKKTPLYP